MKKHNRKSIRLKGYDYTSIGRYFVTIVVRNRWRLFGKVVNGEMALNTFGEIAEREWVHTLRLRNNLSLGAFMIMPDHIHFVVNIEVAINQTEHTPEELERRAGAVKGKDICKEGSLGSLVRGYKAAVTNQIKTLIYAQKENKSDLSESAFTELNLLIRKIDLKKTLWVRNYHEIIIRDQRAYLNISKYINNNPKKWDEDLKKKLGLHE
jgi:REP element-mobilizing transposase RayT